jgi:hypothetical protein
MGRGLDVGQGRRPVDLGFAAVESVLLKAASEIGMYD